MLSGQPPFSGAQVAASTVGGNGSVPVGGVINYFGTALPDDSWLFCDGSAVPA